jgi:hypothetical protein
MELLTVEEYASLPDDPRYRDELSRGQLVREPGVTLQYDIRNRNKSARVPGCRVECGVGG